MGDVIYSIEFSNNDSIWDDVPFTYNDNIVNLEKELLYEFLYG